jgi:hypothetical protein
MIRVQTLAQAVLAVAVASFVSCGPSQSANRSVEGAADEPADVIVERLSSAVRSHVGSSRFGDVWIVGQGERTPIVVGVGIVNPSDAEKSFVNRWGSSTIKPKVVDVRYSIRELRSMARLLDQRLQQSGTPHITLIEIDSAANAIVVGAIDRPGVRAWVSEQLPRSSFKIVSDDLGHTEDGWDVPYGNG